MWLVLKGDVLHHRAQSPHQWAPQKGKGGSCSFYSNIFRKITHLWQCRFGNHHCHQYCRSYHQVVVPLYSFPCPWVSGHSVPLGLCYHNQLRLTLWLQSPLPCHRTNQQSPSEQHQQFCSPFWHTCCESTPSLLALQDSAFLPYYIHKWCGRGGGPYQDWLTVDHQPQSRHLKRF